jgi:hypothetical protein
MAVYPGYPPYVEQAAVELGLPHAAIADAQRQPAVHQISSLVSQVLAEGPRHTDTVRRLRELRDGLCVAALAGILLTQLVDEAPLPVTIRRAGGPAEPVEFDPDSDDSRTASRPPRKR